MIDSYQLFYLGICKDNLIFLNITNSLLMWSFLIVSFIVIIAISTFFLFKYSKKPKKWSHQSLIKEGLYNGVLRDLSESVKSDKKLNEYKSSIDQTILMMFFKKIEDEKDVSYNELVDMKKKNSNKLYEIIGDNDIINWMRSLEQDKEKTDKFGKIKRINKQKYLKEINTILDKMEAWGK